VANVRMKIQITGYRSGKEWPARGELLDCSASEAEHLVNAGYAEHLDEADVDEPAAPPTDPPPAADAPPDGTIPAVMAWVAGDPARARTALDAEVAKGDAARKTLMANLEEIATQGGTDETTAQDPRGPGNAPGGPDGTPAGAEDPAAAGTPADNQAAAPADPEA